MVTFEQHKAIETVVYKSCLALDARDWKAYLSLCDDGFSYRILAYSPEIRRDMNWLEHDKKGMDNLFNTLPKHNSDHSPITRHVTIYTVDLDEAKGEAKVVSALQVFRTALDGGVTELFAVGRYHDTVKLGANGASLAERTVRLDTRGLGYGYHIPF